LEGTEGGGKKVRLREHLKNVPEYVPGKSVDEVMRLYGLKRVVKLASNENPYGASPKVREVLANFDGFHVYPSPGEMEELAERISDYLGVEKERIVLGAGIDGILENVFKMLVDPLDEVVIPVPSFPYYHTLSAIMNARDVRVRRRENFEIDLEGVRRSISDRTKMVVVCSPNNPTGNVEDPEVVREIAESFDVLVFVDEAYAEFSNTDMLDLSDYENVVIARTFSKAFGLANLRIGYAVMSSELKRAYMKVSTPFPVSSVAIRCAMAALDDIDHMRRCVERIREERERLYSELGRRVKVYPSEANFLFFESNVRASELVEELMKRGVIVRDCSRFVGCSPFAVRVSVGRREENDLFLSALDEVL